MIFGWYLDYMWVISGLYVGDIWMMFEFERIHSETPKHTLTSNIETLKIKMLRV